MDSIRGEYQQYGVKNFYQWHSKEYKNPHEPIIRKTIEYVDEKWNIDFSKVLDLSCGKGEVTKSLIKLGYNKIEGVDPYMGKYYELETNKNCIDMSFDDIINGNLDGSHYSIIVCSFALHLLEQSKLPIFLYKLTQLTDQLLTLTPHKRPDIKEDWGWKLVNEISIDRVKSRLYNNIFF